MGRLEAGSAGLAIWNSFAANVAYWIPAAYFILWFFFAVFCLHRYAKAKKIYAAWDGENEENINGAERLINICGFICSILFILGLLAMVVWAFFVPYSGSVGLWHIVGAVLLFVLSFALTWLLLRHAINMEKMINPEKKGDLLELGFEKHWHGSFDEAQKLIQYKSAYKAFRITNMACMLLWVFCIVGVLAADIGIAPILVLGTLWLISVSAYHIEMIRLENKR